MHVADAQPIGSTRIGRGGGNFLQDALDVERGGGDLQIAAGPFPRSRSTVAVDLDAVALGIVEVERLAHRVVGSARERYLVARHVQDPAREIATRRHQERGVIESRAARVVGLGLGLVLEVNEPHAAGAERAGVLGAIEDREPEHVAVEAGHPVEVAHLETDRPDMERRATGEGGRGGRVWGIHPGYIDPCGKPRNSALTAGCRGKSRSAIGSLGLVPFRSAPCPSTPPPSAASRILRASRSPRTRSSTCGGSSTPSLPSWNSCRKSTSRASNR